MWPGNRSERVSIGSGRCDRVGGPPAGSERALGDAKDSGDASPSGGGFRGDSGGGTPYKAGSDGSRQSTDDCQIRRKKHCQGAVGRWLGQLAGTHIECLKSKGG